MTTNNNEWKAHFEANMLDGDKVEDCGKAILSAEGVWEYIEEVIAQDRKERADELRKKIDVVPNYGEVKGELLYRRSDVLSLISE